MYVKCVLYIYLLLIYDWYSVGYIKKNRVTDFELMRCAGHDIVSIIICKYKRVLFIFDWIECAYIGGYNADVK